MADPTAGNRPPWHAVLDTGERAPVAPSKPILPAAPTTASRVPESIEAEEADVIAPVTMPPSEELMPTVSPPPPDGDQPRAAVSGHPFRSLSDAAIRNASLGAAGAPTPLGGVPVVPQTGATAPSSPSSPLPGLGDDGEDYQPPFSLVAGIRRQSPQDAVAQETPDGEGAPDEADAPETPDEAEDASEPRAPDEAIQEGDIEGPAVGRPAPAFPATDAPAQDGGDSHDTPPPDAPSDDTPWWRSLWFLILVGLLVMGGVGAAVYALFFAPEDVELPGPVIVEGPPPPALEPIDLTDPTDFLAAMPLTVGEFALTAVESPAVADAALPVRAFEVHDLTYSTEDVSVDVRAIQHFSEDDAAVQFAELAEDGDAPQPVEAGDAVVGERVTIADGEHATIVWSNGSVVFVATGPTEAVEQLWIQFPL